MLCFLETPVLRFALLPYYRRSDDVCVIDSLQNSMSLKILTRNTPFFTLIYNFISDYKLYPIFTITLRFGGNLLNVLIVAFDSHK